MAPDPTTQADTSAIVIGKIDQKALTAQGQRKVNLIWEYTQATIALAVVATNLLVYAHMAFSSSKVDIPVSLSNTMFLVVGFYFSRTNHAAIGGVGAKPTEEYTGR